MDMEREVALRLAWCGCCVDCLTWKERWGMKEEGVGVVKALHRGASARIREANDFILVMSIVSFLSLSAREINDEEPLFPNTTVGRPTFKQSRQ